VCAPLRKYENHEFDGGRYECAAWRIRTRTVRGRDRNSAVTR
jgi:hypothetical protein